MAFLYFKNTKERPATLVLGISNYYKLQKELGQENVRSYKAMGITFIIACAKFFKFFNFSN